MTLWFLVDGEPLLETRNLVLSCGLHNVGIRQPLPCGALVSSGLELAL